MKKLFFILIVPFLLLLSCKKTDFYTTAEQGRDALYYIMTNYYLWYKELPENVSLDNYEDPYELMDSLRYRPIDRWSFVADYTSFWESVTGTFVGHGIRMGLDTEDKVRIVTIFKNSPLYSNPGVRRGWIIKSLNGEDLASIFISQDAVAYNNLIGPSEAGYTNTFVFETPEGNNVLIETEKKNFQVNSVLLYDTLTINKIKTGHLVFNEFIEPSSAELDTAFRFFKEHNVKELILDLRYNSGGLLNVATELASYIAGDPVVGKKFVTYSYNDKNLAENKSTLFKSVNYPLNLKRVVIITTRETASASEEVINGLKPYMEEVVTIGDTTDGKPTGMNIWPFASKYIFAPVTFELVNSNNEGDFYNGFAPGKYVTDDITHDFNDKNELCFKEAIYYLENDGVFSSKSSYPYYKLPTHPEKPTLMKNLYILDR